MLSRQAAGETPTLPEASASPTVVAQPIVAQPIDFVDGWLHLSIAQASLALLSVRAAILHSSFFTLHLKKSFSPLTSNGMGILSVKSWPVPRPCAITLLPVP